MAVAFSGLDETGATNNAATLTTGSISPAANSMVLFVLASKSNVSAHIWTYTSDTFGDTLTVTKVAEFQEADAVDATITIFRVQFDASPGSGTITFTSRNDGDTADVNAPRRVLQSIEVTGHDSSSPITQSKSGTGDTSVVMDSSFGSGGAAFGAINSWNEAGGITPGTDFTEIYDQQYGSGGNNTNLQTQYDLTPADTTIDWSDINQLEIMIGLEIAEASSGVTINHTLITATITSFAPSVFPGVDVGHTLVTATMTSYIPVVGAGVDVSHSIEVVTFTSFLPVIRGGVDINHTMEVAAITDFVPTISIPVIAVNHTIEVATVTDFVPVVLPGINVSHTLEVATVTSFTPIIRVGVDVSHTIEAATITDFVPTALPGVDINHTLEVATIADFIPTVRVGVDISHTIEAATITDFVPTIVTADDVTVNHTIEAATITDFSPTILVGVDTNHTIEVATITDFVPTIVVGADTTINHSIEVATIGSFAPRVNIVLAFPHAGTYAKNTRHAWTAWHANKIDGNLPTIVETTAANLESTIEGASANTVIMISNGGVATVSGAVNLTTDSIYLAGQSAPGEGIAFHGGTFAIQAVDILIRGVKFRFGVNQNGVDAVGIGAVAGKPQVNILLDHCVMAHGSDENIGGNFSTQKDPSWNIGFSYCLSYECLLSPLGGGPHSMGGLVSRHVKNISWYRCAFHSNNSRNPSYGTVTTTPTVRLANVATFGALPGSANEGEYILVEDASGDTGLPAYYTQPEAFYEWVTSAWVFRDWAPMGEQINCVISNYGTQPSIMGASDHVSYIGNICKQGPDSSVTHQGNTVRLVNVNTGATVDLGSIYAEDNITDATILGNDFDNSVTNQSDVIEVGSPPVLLSGSDILPSDIIAEHILDNVGSQPWDDGRDTAEERIITELTTNLQTTRGTAGSAGAIPDAIEDVFEGANPTVASGTLPSRHATCFIPLQWLVDEGLAVDTSAAAALALNDLIRPGEELQYNGYSVLEVYLHRLLNSPPTHVIEVATIVDFIPAISLGANSTVNHNLETATIADFVPTIIVGVDINHTLEVATLASFLPTTRAGVNINTTLETATIADFAPTVLIGVDIIHSIEVATITSFVPTIDTGAGNVTINHAIEAATITDFAPTVLVGVDISHTIEVATITDFVPLISQGVEVAHAIEAATLIDFAPSVTVGVDTNHVIEVATITDFIPTIQVGVIPPGENMNLPSTIKKVMTLKSTMSNNMIIYSTIKKFQ